MKRVLLVCLFVACLALGGFIVWGAGGDFYVIPVRQAAIPEGTIIMWSGEIDPEGHPIINGKSDTRWHVCDGTDGTPDLRGRFVWGSVPIPGGGWNTGEVGGAASATLSIDNLPEHTHRVSGATFMGGAHSHDVHGVCRWSWGRYITWITIPGDTLIPDGFECSTFTTHCGDPGLDCGRHNHSFSTDSQATGGGQSFNILPPYYALVFLMYTGA